MGVKKVTRWLPRLCVGLVFGMAWVGCEKSQEQIVASRPVKEVKQLEGALVALKNHLGEPNYSRANDPAISAAQQAITEYLPMFINEASMDESVKEEVLAKLEEIDKVFADRVLGPVDGKPQDLAKGAEGVDECLPLVVELKSLLGG